MFMWYSSLDRISPQNDTHHAIPSHRVPICCCKISRVSSLVVRVLNLASPSKLLSPHLSTKTTAPYRSTNSAQLEHTSFVCRRSSKEPTLRFIRGRFSGCYFYNRSLTRVQRSCLLQNNKIYITNSGLVVAAPVLRRQRCVSSYADGEAPTAAATERNGALLWLRHTFNWFIAVVSPRYPLPLPPASPSAIVQPSDCPHFCMTIKTSAYYTRTRQKVNKKYINGNL